MLSTTMCVCRLQWVLIFTVTQYPSALTHSRCNVRLAAVCGLQYVGFIHHYISKHHVMASHGGLQVYCCCCCCCGIPNTFHLVWELPCPVGQVIRTEHQPNNQKPRQFSATSFEGFVNIGLIVVPGGARQDSHQNNIPMLQFAAANDHCVHGHARDTVGLLT